MIKWLYYVSTLPPAEVKALAKVFEQLEDERMCKICLDAESVVVFLPCGHRACCSPCALALATCPICRTRIKGRVRVADILPVDRKFL